MSLVCFQYLRVGTEQVADRAPVVAAGRQRGYDLIEQLGLLGSTTDPALIHQHLSAALGEQGTRLCIIKSMTLKPNQGYEVRLFEGACTAGQSSITPLCAFTLGVFIGAVHAITGTRVKGTETQCCACGADECVYQIDPI
jgi:predicted hydrocarbon binding protein